MTQKELRKLGSKRLLEMIAEQTENANRLERENERLKKRIANREQYLAQMGDLAKDILHSAGDLRGAAERHPAAAKALSEVPAPREGEGGHDSAGAYDEYRIYKVFHAAVSGTGISYTLLEGKTDVPAGSHFLLSNGYVVHDGVTLEDGRLTDEDIQAIAAYVEGDEPYKTVPITSENPEPISVEPGYYYIITASGTVVMVGGTAPDDDADMDIAEAPSVTMVVTSGDGGDRMADEDGNIMIQAGAAAHFEVTIDVKRGARDYRLVDTMDKRLRHEDSRITIYTVNKDDQWSVLDSRYWSHNWDTETAYNDILTVVFYEDDDHKGAVPEDIAQIVATYDAAAGDELINGAKNIVRVEYGANNTPDSEVRIYNAKMTVSTVTEAEENGQKGTAPLTGASFMLGKNPAEDGGYESYYVYDKAAGKISWTDTPLEAAVVEAHTGPNENQAVFTGLEAGTYYLIEKDVPAGCQKADDLKFEIKDDDYGTENLAQEADMVNTAGVRLPSAGGMGIPVSTTAGGFQLKLGSTALHITNQRRKDG